MNTFTNKLDIFESKLQELIEGKLSRLTSKRDDYEGLSRQLVSSMRTPVISTADGTMLAPDQFTILVHPSNQTSFSEDPEILVVMANLIRTEGMAAGLQFGHHPVVNISPNNDVPTDKIEIIARFSNQAMGHTANLNINVSTDESAVQNKSFLIGTGIEVFSLNQPVINIGRSSNNHLQIDDLRVSRQHAQIRTTNGRYEIFDLDSTGGTFINQNRIKKSLLHPGDVISLAGVLLIYGQEDSSSLKDTKELLLSDNLNEPNP